MCPGASRRVARRGRLTGRLAVDGQSLAGHGRVDDVEEVVLERRSANEEAVDVGAPAELGGVAALHRAAVLDPRGRGDGGRHVSGQPGADEGVDLLGLRRSRDLAGADGPHWLVGNGDLGPVLLREGRAEGHELRRDDVPEAAVLTRLELLTHAGHHRESSIDSDLGLGRHKLVGLAEHLTALRVARNAPGEAEVDKLRRGELASKGAHLRVHTHVLSGDGDVRGEVRGHVRDVESNRSNDNLTEVGDLGGVKDANESLGGGHGPITFPVASDQELLASGGRRLGGGGGRKGGHGWSGV
mmetsp:Transcript_96606/g.275713  ORF Transcript_96606/g.275713 Transcript_96606/m.275713 type:complete len:299 (+) Transcript_96606:300-1196(+)